MSLIEQASIEYSKSFEHLKDELSSIRTGRANPKILENIQVDAYDTKTPLIQLASISVPEARSIVIQPWDKNICKDIEKAIVEASLGLSPVNEGSQLRVAVPQMTEEDRKKIVKEINERLEKTRISIRTIRDKIKETIIEQEREKEITEDDKYKSIEELDKTTKEFNDQIKNLGAQKEQEIMTI